METNNTPPRRSTLEHMPAVTVGTPSSAETPLQQAPKLPVSRSSGVLKRSIAARGPGTGFSEDKMGSLLEVLENALPLYRNDGDAAGRMHGITYAGLGRTANSLERKLAAFYRKKMPTGDPIMSENVRRAKLIRVKMTELGELGEGEESVTLYDEFLSGIQGSTIIPQTLEMEVQSGEGAPQTVKRCVVVETEAEHEHVEQMGQNPSQFGSKSEKISSEPTTPSPRDLVGKKMKKQNIEENGDFLAAFQASILGNRSRRVDEYGERKRNERSKRK